MTRVLVAGFGRCGSTMMMRMLDAGGLPPAGPVAPISYEAVGGQAAMMDLIHGDAPGPVKTLDLPLYGYPPITVPTLTIWLERSPDQQAKSTAKLMAVVGVRLTNREVKAVTETYLRDEGPCLHAYGTTGPVLRLRYRDVLARPHAEALRVAGFVGLPPAAARVMADVVHDRTEHCAPDLRFESTGEPPTRRPAALRMR